MQLTTVTFGRKVTFDRGCNEEFILTAKVEDGEDPDDVMDDLRVMADEALERSKRDRMAMKFPQGYDPNFPE